MDISLDLMYADLERLSSLYSQLASMQFTVDNPEMIVAKSLAFAMVLSLLIALMMVIPNMYLTDYLSSKVKRWEAVFIVLEIVVFIISTVILFEVFNWWENISLQRDINAVTAQIEMIEARWGL